MICVSWVYLSAQNQGETRVTLGGKVAIPALKFWVAASIFGGMVTTNMIRVPKNIAVAQIATTPTAPYAEDSSAGAGVVLCEGEAISSKRDLTHTDEFSGCIIFGKAREGLGNHRFTPYCKAFEGIRALLG